MTYLHLSQFLWWAAYLILAFGIFNAILLGFRLWQKESEILSSGESESHETPTIQPVKKLTAAQVGKMMLTLLIVAGIGYGVGEARVRIYVKGQSEWKKADADWQKQYQKWAEVMAKYPKEGTKQ